jgi:hypothetical protein
VVIQPKKPREIDVEEKLREMPERRDVADKKREQNNFHSLGENRD